MAGTAIPRAARNIPPSTAENRHRGRTPHWVKPNHTERIPHRWIIVDCESKKTPVSDGEIQHFRLGVAVRWRTDLKSGEQREMLKFTDPLMFWEWVRDWCYTHGRTFLFGHNVSVDLAWLDAFTHLPKLGYDLQWCNMDRQVSVASWRSMHGTLVIADTYSFTGKALKELAPLTGVPKPPLPDDDDSSEAWFHRCTSDVLITEIIVRQLIQFVRDQHLGNWQPSGAGMAWAAWRHRFYTHKILIHDDDDALNAEREAMHTGRAEAWYHGKPPGGPFTDYDMHMSYCRIAAECLLPTKLWDHDKSPSRSVHQFGLDHWRTLARVRVHTDVPVVPVRNGGRTIWPVGTFDTVLWDCELRLLREYGGSYDVHEQWRYSRKPCLKEWAEWSIMMCGTSEPAITGVQKAWVKHQSRALIGRMGLRVSTWEQYCDNWMPYTGISFLSEHGSAEMTRLMHVGSQVFRESGKDEAQQSCPQITSWVMAESRCRLWRAADAAGFANVVHVDTDSLIVNAIGARQLDAAIAAGLPGGWRPKDHWRRLDVTGPRHYSSPTTRQLPGVPRTAVETRPGTWEGERWDSLASTLTDGLTGVVRIRRREWTPRKIDNRRPYQGEENGAAIPITLDITQANGAQDENELHGIRAQRPGSTRNAPDDCRDRAESVPGIPKVRPTPAEAMAAHTPKDAPGQPGIHHR
jgi:hypothetical protein